MTTTAAADDLPGAAATGDGGREIPSDAAAVRHVIPFPARPPRPVRVRLAGEVMVLPVIPRRPDDPAFNDLEQGHD